VALPIEAARTFYGFGGEGTVTFELGFDQVYAQHVKFVWRTLRALGVPVELVEDAVQDVFIVVHRRLPEFVGGASAKAWIFQIARRVARHYRRTLRRKGPHEALPESVSDDRPDPADRVAHVEGLRLLEAALGDLDEQRREVLVLTEIEQMSAPEIAELLKVRLNTVYSRLRRARAAFQEALELHRGKHR
jgi:RNA polymerase sigma-70 factor, ECF subfamily